MPALVLSERATADLSPLRDLPGAAARDFCAQGLDALEGRGDAGARAAGWSRAAAALGLPSDAVAGAVMALTELLLAAARAGAGEADVGAALAEAGLSEPPRRAIAEVSELDAANGAFRAAHFPLGPHRPPRAARPRAVLRRRGAAAACARVRRRRRGRRGAAARP